MISERFEDRLKKCRRNGNSVRGTSEKKGYCLARKELLALREYVTRFRQYPEGKLFISRTDHKTLVFMNTSKKPISPSWIANLFDYNCELKYKKGEDSNADAVK